MILCEVPMIYNGIVDLRTQLEYSQRHDNAGKELEITELNAVGDAKITNLQTGKVIDLPKYHFLAWIGSTEVILRYDNVMKIARIKTARVIPDYSSEPPGPVISYFNLGFNPYDNYRHPSMTHNSLTVDSDGRIWWRYPIISPDYSFAPRQARFNTKTMEVFPGDVMFSISVERDLENNGIFIDYMPMSIVQDALDLPAYDNMVFDTDIKTEGWKEICPTKN